ncbi:MAG: MarR family transcriptional regulator [Thiotrichales bacterium]|nr:MarR family transcriptional regulator [Thiotrichales bacterium]
MTNPTNTSDDVFQNLTEASPTQQMLLNLFLSQKMILQQSEHIVHRHHFTTLEFDVLATLQRLYKQGQTQIKPSDIVKNLCVSSGGITKVLKSLELAQLISRQADANDKRIHWVFITPKGQTVCQEILSELFALHDQQIEPALTKAEIQQMADSLLKLVNHLNQS